MNNLVGTDWPDLLGRSMTNAEFGEFYNVNYQPMPGDFYPEITWYTDYCGTHWRKTAKCGFAYPCYSETDRAEMDDRLRQMEWNASEMMRIKALAGIE